MQTDRLFEVLSNLHPIHEEFKSSITKELIILSLPKNYHLLEAPKISSHIYFLNSGSAITYVFNNGEKQVESFWQQGSIIISIKSFFDQVPSLEYIQLLESSDVMHISYQSVCRLLDTYPEANILCRKILNQYHEILRNRIREFQSLSVKQRYIILRKNFPLIEQLLSQEMIASYLGITPQSLSRLKKRNGSI